MKIHILQHANFETPGYILDWAKTKDHKISFTNFFEAFTFPFPSDIDMLVVMGGPMSISDEDKYSWLVEEKEYISEMISKRKKVVGICLGSQLIAEALGAEVYANTQKEIGWFNIKAQSENDLLNLLPEEITAFHWHGQTYDLPIACDRLFSSEATLNQGFLYKNRVLAMQFHLEIKPEGVIDMMEACRNDLTEGKFVQTEKNILAEKAYFQNNRRLLFKILDFMEGE